MTLLHLSPCQKVISVHSCPHVFWGKDEREQEMVRVAHSAMISPFEP